MSVNLCTFIGNLGKDPESRVMPNGESVSNFSLACTDKYKDKATGESKEITEWVRVQAFGKLADICNQYIKKGSQVYIEGRMKTRKWTDANGQDKYLTEIIASKMQMLGGKPTEATQHAAPQAAGLDDDEPF